MLQQALCRLSFELAQDPFGNYALSTMIATWPETLAVLICTDGPLLPRNIVELSLQKFSSNVVDKLVQSASLEQILLIMRQLENSDQLDKIMVS
jgi:hypothetical protein